MKLVLRISRMKLFTNLMSMIDKAILTLIELYLGKDNIADE